MCKGWWGDEMYPIWGKHQVKNLRNVLSPSMSHSHAYSRIYSAKNWSLIPANDTVNYLWVKLWGSEEHWTFQRQRSLLGRTPAVPDHLTGLSTGGSPPGTSRSALGGKGCSWDFLSAQGLSVEGKELSPLTSSPALSLPTQHMSILLCPPALSSLLDFLPRPYSTSPAVLKLSTPSDTANGLILAASSHPSALHPMASCPLHCPHTSSRAIMTFLYEG